MPYAGFVDRAELMEIVNQQVTGSPGRDAFCVGLLRDPAMFIMEIQKWT